MAGILIGNNIALLKKGIEAATTAWKKLEERGLSLGSEEVGALKAASGKQRPVLTGNVSGCQVEIHIRSDTVHYATTEIAAKPPKGVDAVVGVHPSPGGVLGHIRSWLGQDILVGDEAFDESFLVTGKPESAAKALVGPTIQQHIAILAGARLAGFSYTKDRVSVVMSGVETDPAVLGTAIDLVCAAATWSA